MKKREQSKKLDIVVFDGECVFCNGLVHFVIARDPTGHFRFAPMQSAYAKDLMKSYQVDNIGLDTMVLVKRGKAFIRSTAMLEIVRRLSGLWPILFLFIIVPRPIRDFCYSMFSRNRYLFGRRSYCTVPTEKMKSRIISD